MMMKFLGFVFLGVVMMSYSLASGDGDFQVETVREELKDVLIVRGNTGHAVTVIDVFVDGGYELLKPIAEDDYAEGDYVCFVSRFDVKDDETSACFERVPLPKGEEDQIDLTECGDREVFFLLPINCNKNVSKREDGNELDRQKRASCFYREVQRSRCVKTETYCRQFGWWTGRSTCKSWGSRCTKYAVEVIQIFLC